MPRNKMIFNKTALVLGGHGFIGHHISQALKQEGFWVRTVDIKEYPYGKIKANNSIIGDLRNHSFCKKVFKGPTDKPFDEVYQLAACTGGAGFTSSGMFDYQIIQDNILLNASIIEAAKSSGIGKLFLSSTTSVYPGSTNYNPITSESTAYPANPITDYGWVNLIIERLYQACSRNHGLKVRIARLSNIFGPEGAWDGGLEGSVAALCRKIALTENGRLIDVWGDGDQTRSYLYIDECINGIRKLMDSDFEGPVNIGSDKMISINELIEIIKRIAGKPNIRIRQVDGPQGVRGCTSDNKLLMDKLNWLPSTDIEQGLMKTYAWVKEQYSSK